MDEPGKVDGLAYRLEYRVATSPEYPLLVNLFAYLDGAGPAEAEP